MKEYVVHTSLSDEEFDRRVDELDFHKLLRDSIQFVYDDMMKCDHATTSEAESNEPITAARRNYGGAYDIDPYQYFTTEELMEFGDKAASRISDELRKDEDVWVQMRDIYIVDYNRVVVEFDVNDDESEISVSFNIDMRKIRKPSDIDKYLPEVVDKAVAEYHSYYGMDTVESSVFTSNPYDLGPEDPAEPEDVFDTHEIFDVDIDTIITVHNQDDWDYASTEWAAPEESVNKRGFWKSSNYAGLTLMEDSSVIEAVDELLLPYIPMSRGRYQLKAHIELWVDIEDIVYWGDEDGYDFSDVNYTININKSKITLVDVKGI